MAVDPFDYYSASGDWTLDLVDDPARYLPTVEGRLRERAPARDALDLVLYNAGMDPFEGCPVGGLPGITAEMLMRRERLVFDWCREASVPVAFVLAGGYAAGKAAQAQLVGLHRATIEAAVDA